MRILLTGFNPFGEITQNPSQNIVENIEKRFSQQKNPYIITQVLPTEFDKSGKFIEELIQQHKPEVILLLGVSSREEKLTFERVALNLNDTNIPDNAGKIQKGVKIEENAPLAYFSNLSLEKLCDALAPIIPTKISNHAGTYVCNHVFFKANFQIRKLKLESKCGFIHIPLNVSIEKLTTALEYVIKNIREFI